MKRTVINRTLIGFVIGFIVGVIITPIVMSIVMGDGKLYMCTTGFSEFIGNPVLAFILHSLVCGLYGAVGFASSAIYEIESWSILKATIVHFLLILFCFYSATFFLRIISPTNVKALIISFAISVVMYVIVWIIIYMSYKSDVETINDVISSRKEKGLE